MAIVEFEPVGINKKVGVDGLAAFEPNCRKNGILTSRQREVLIGMGRGFSREEIAGRLKLSRNTVRNHWTDLSGRLGRPSCGLNAVSLALDMGELKLEEMVDRFDLQNFKTLTPAEILVLEVLVKDNGANSCNKIIARDLGLSHYTIRNHMASIRGKLETRNKVQTGVLFLAYRKQNQN